MSWREFSSDEGRSKRFWNVELSGNCVTIHHGRFGTSGRRQTREFATPQEASRAAERLIAEKLCAGYRELPAKLNDARDTAVARTRFRVGQTWSFKTAVPNIHPVLQILGVEEHPQKGIFCFLDIKFRRAVTEKRGGTHSIVSGIELCLTAVALDRSLEQLVDAKAPLPDHYTSTGEFSAAPEHWLQDKMTDIRDSTLDEAILNHLSQAFPARVAKAMGWPTRPKARRSPGPSARPEQEAPAGVPPEQRGQSESFAMADAIARGDLKQVRGMIEADPAAVNTPLLIDPGDEKLNPAGTAAASPLHFAAAQGKLKVVELLLDHGASINATSAEGWTPLFVATRFVKSRPERIVAVLEQHGAALDLHSAIWLYRFDWVKEHLRSHKRAVQEALFPGRLIEDTIHVTDIRLMEAADGDDLDDAPETSAAILEDAREIIELLLDRGADPNGGRESHCSWLCSYQTQPSPDCCWIEEPIPIENSRLAGPFTSLKLPRVNKCGNCSKTMMPEKTPIIRAAIIERKDMSLSGWAVSAPNGSSWSTPRIRR